MIVTQVTAMNHVSSLTEHFNVTVDQMKAMSDITVLGVPNIVPQGSNLSLSASIFVDISVDATFRSVLQLVSILLCH